MSTDFIIDNRGGLFEGLPENEEKKLINAIVQQVLEQIEEAKLSELGNVIEKLKEEYK